MQCNSEARTNMINVLEVWLVNRRVLILCIYLCNMYVCWTVVALDICVDRVTTYYYRYIYIYSIIFPPWLCLMSGCISLGCNNSQEICHVRCLPVRVLDIVPVLFNEQWKFAIIANANCTGGGKICGIGTVCGEANDAMWGKNRNKHSTHVQIYARTKYSHQNSL